MRRLQRVKITAHYSFAANLSLLGRLIK